MLTWFDLSTSLPSTTLSVLALPLGQNHLDPFLLLLLCNKFKSIWVGSSSSSNSIGNCWAPKLSDIFVACCQQQRRQQQLELEKIYCQQICLNAAIFPFLLSFYNGCYSALSMLTFFTFSLLTFCRAPSWQNVVNFPSTALWWWWQSSLSPLPPTLANKKRLEGSILLLPYLQCTVAKKEGREVVFLRFSSFVLFSLTTS